jgi:hypothetical protein
MTPTVLNETPELSCPVQYFTSEYPKIFMHFEQIRSLTILKSIVIQLTPPSGYSRAKYLT